MQDRTISFAFTDDPVLEKSEDEILLNFERNEQNKCDWYVFSYDRGHKNVDELSWTIDRKEFTYTENRANQAFHRVDTPVF